MITLETVKTLLGIVTTDDDAPINLLIPMVSNDVRRILNNSFNEKVYCTFKAGIKQVTGLNPIGSHPSTYGTREVKLNNPLEIGRMLAHPNLPEETYITAWDYETGIAEISEDPISDGEYVITSITYGMLIPIAKMCGFKMGGMTTKVCDGELASKSMGTVSVSYVQHSDQRWGYPLDILRDLGTPIQRVG